MKTYPRQPIWIDKNGTVKMRKGGSIRLGPKWRKERPHWLQDVTTTPPSMLSHWLVGQLAEKWDGLPPVFIHERNGKFAIYKLTISKDWRGKTNASAEIIPGFCATEDGT